MKILELVLAVLFLYSSGCYAYFKLAGPYEVSIDDFYECDDVGTHKFQHTLRMKKFNATTKVLHGNVTFNGDFIASYKSIAAKWSSGGWGQNAFPHDGNDACSDWRDYLWEFFETLCNALGIPPQCPFPSGTHSTLKGMPLVFRNFRMFPSLPYGRYRSEVAIYNGNTRVGCSVIKVTIDEIASTSMFG